MTKNTRHKICAFTGEVQRKQQTHIEAIIEAGLSIDVFVTRHLESSQKYLTGENRAILQKASFLSRTQQIYSYLKKHHRQIHHMELYGGGRFVFMYVLLAKLFGIKILLIERGGLNQYIRKDTKKYLTKFSTYILYKFADICWYKEYYMLPYLKKFGLKNLRFIPNSVGHFDFDTALEGFKAREIDYLWVNNIIPERHIDWIIDIASHPDMKDKRFEIYGFGETPYAQSKLSAFKKRQLPNVSLFPYVDDVLSKYRQARYFLLAADYVFGNNALIEAMAHGAVPIVTDMSGVEHIITSDKNGLVSKNEKEAYTAIVLSSIKLNSNTWNDMSQASRTKIKEDYDLDSFKSKVKALYEEIGGI